MCRELPSFMKNCSASEIKVVSSYCSELHTCTTYGLAPN